MFGRVLDGEASFDDVVATKDTTFFANGLAIDAFGMYVANSFPGASAGIYRSPNRRGATVNLELWHQRVGCWPNGVKVGRDKDVGDAVYYTGLIPLPVPSSVLIRVEIKADGSPGDSTVLYTRVGAIFDDFDIIENENGFENGFIVAEEGSISPFRSGALLFVDTNGQLAKTIEHDSLKHPSAVKIVAKKAGQFEKGDILVTEKAGHCLVWLRSEGTLEDNFVSPRKLSPSTSSRM